MMLKPYMKVFGKRFLNAVRKEYENDIITGTLTEKDQ